MIIIASIESVNDIFKWQTEKDPKLAHLDEVLYKWFTAVHSEGKPVTVPVIIEKAKSFLDEMKMPSVHSLRAVAKSYL